MSEARAMPQLVSAGLAGLLLLATLGEGGGSPLALLVWHAWLVALWLLVLVGSGARSASTLAAGPVVALGPFLLLVALGAARAPYKYAAVLVVIELVACLVIVRLAASCGIELLGRLTVPLRIGAAAQGVYALYEVAWLERPRPAGTFLTPNHMALWLVAILLLSVAVGARSRRGWIAVGAAGAPALLAVLLSGSRGALLALAVGGVCLVVLRRRRWFAALWARPARLAAVAGILIVLGSFAAWRLALRFDTFDPFRYHRLKIWRASSGVLTEDPWWGSGPGQFATAAMNHSFPDGDGALRYDRVFSVTHSDLLRVPAELGVPAALALLVAAGLALRHVSRRRRQAGWPDAADGALAVLAALAAEALVDNPSRWASIYVLGSVLVGSLLSARQQRSPLPRGSRAALAGIVLLLFLLADLAPYLAWRQVSGLPRGRLDEASAVRLERAIRLNPIQPDYRLRWSEHMMGDGLAWDLDTYVGAREAAEQAVRLQPADARYRRGLARLEAQACRTLFPDVETRERAAALYRAAERQARNDPSSAIGLAAFLIDTGDPLGARRAAARALRLEPESVLPRLLLADTFIETGSGADLERARGLLDEARVKAAQGAASVSGAYSARLLRLDPAVEQRLESKLRRREAEP